MVIEIGKEVQQFYNKTPFPDYELERFNNKNDLRLAASPFAKILDQSIPADKSIIDMGTGTGQLSAFLSLRRKCVWGTDFSDNSLDKARKLKEKLKLNTLHLKKIDVLDKKQIRDINQEFDYLLCLGVLHHTGNAYEGFRNILKILKPEGYVAIGLYNKMGRIPLKIRKILAKSIFKNNDKIREWFIRMQLKEIEDREKVRGWWNDQYMHPHETTHTIGEVLRWFRKNNIEYYQTLPSLTFFDQSNIEISGVWNKTNETYPYIWKRMFNQLMWVWRTHHEGGYWITFGRKR